jgi:hypothetical protein
VLTVVSVLRKPMVCYGIKHAKKNETEKSLNAFSAACQEGHSVLASEP